MIGTKVRITNPKRLVWGKIGVVVDRKNYSRWINKVKVYDEPIIWWLYDWEIEPLTQNPD